MGTILLFSFLLVHIYFLYWPGCRRTNFAARDGRGPS